MPIGAGRPGTLKAIQAISAEDEKLVFAVSQRENSEKVSPERLHTIGAVARIGQLQRVTGGVQFLLQGEYRGIALRISESSGRLPGGRRTQGRRDVANGRGRQRVCGATLERGARTSGGAGDEGRVPRRSRQAGHPECGGSRAVWPIWSLPTWRYRLRDRQTLLETLSVEERLRQVLVHRAATDRCSGGAGGHQVEGPAGARRPPARDGSPRAAEGDPEGARRRATTSEEVDELQERGGLELPRGAQGEWIGSSPTRPHEP